MKWLLSAIALIACLVLADEARAGGFVQQRVFVQQQAPHCFGQQAFVQQRFQRQNVFVPNFRQQRVFVQQRPLGFQRQNVFVQQPALQFRFNFDD
jgi:hypothetical protein